MDKFCVKICANRRNKNDAEKESGITTQFF